MRILQSIKDILKRPYLMFYSLLVFFTPLLFIQNASELFEFPKIIFVYLMVFFTIAFFLTDIILNPIKLKKPHFVILILLFLSFISLILSSHRYTSFFGYYSRFNDSFLSHLSLFGLYFVGINKLKKSDLEKILKISLFTILPISFFGLSQYFSGTSRVFSTIGQPNWLAQYLGILLPIVVYFSITENSKKFKIWFMVYVFGFYCLWVTYSVSGVLSYFVAFAVLIIGIVKNKKGNYGDFKLRLFLITSITVFIVLSNLGMFKDKMADVLLDLKKQTFLVKKVYAQVSENIISDPGFIRIELWKSTLGMIFSKPKTFLIGSGLETFPYDFQPFRNLSLNYSSEWDFVFNKPHNYYLEIFAESGIFSLFLYLFLLMILFRKLPIFLTPSIVAFAVSNIFGWPTVSTSLLFCILLIFIDGSLKKEGVATIKHNNYRKILIIPVWLIYFFFLSKISDFYYADIYYNKSQKLIEKGMHEEALYYANRAIDKIPFEPSYYRGRAKINTVFLVKTPDSVSTKEKIFSDLKKAEELNPNNLVTIRNSIPIYYFLGVGDVFSNIGVGNIDEKYIDHVIEFFTNTKNRYWNDVGVILAVAKYEKKLGLEESYNFSVERVREIRPDLLEWHELFR